MEVQIGANVTMNNVCFIENQFMTDGVIIVNGIEHISYNDVYTDNNSNLDIECLFIYNNDTNACIESDATTCGLVVQLPPTNNQPSGPVIPTIPTELLPSQPSVPTIPNPLPVSSPTAPIPAPASSSYTITTNNIFSSMGMTITTSTFLIIIMTMIIVL